MVFRDRGYHARSVYALELLQFVRRSEHPRVADEDAPRHVRLARPQHHGHPGVLSKVSLVKTGDYYY